MVGRTNACGGGSGGTLTVTGIAGHTVTATKDGKTYTRTFNSGGVAVFKGLSTGTWTLTMTGDGQTATRTVDVNADYAITITYFSATISITYPAGSTCKATHTDGTVLNAPDTSGTWACVVPKSGTWTILAEDTSSGKSKSVDVSITTDGQSESVTLNYSLMLYDAGDEFDEVTGGWSYTGDNSPVFNAHNIVVEPTVSNGTCVLTTVNKINLTGIKTLHFYLKCDTTGSLENGGDCQAVGANTSNEIRVDRNRMTADVKVPTAADYKDYTVDVSALSGSYYILVATLSPERIWYAKLTVSKIWGEYV